MPETVPANGAAAAPTAPPPAPASTPFEKAIAAMEAHEAKAEAAASAPVEPTPAPDTAPVAEPEKAAPTQAQRFADMARKQRIQFEKERALKDREARLAAKEAEHKAFEERRQAYRQDPMKALEDSGWTYEDLTKRILNSTDPSVQQNVALRQLAARQDEMARRLEAKEREAEEATRRAAQLEQQSFADRFKGDIRSTIDANPDKYELTKLYGQTDLVYSVIATEYEQTGEVIPIDAAAEKVEKYLESEAAKVLTAKKFQAKLAPAPSASPTLTNKTTQSPAPSAKSLSEKERIARAIAALGD